MTSYLIPLTILIPWVGAAAVWLAGDRRPKMQHTLAVIFALAAGGAALALLPLTEPGLTWQIPFGRAFGNAEFRADGLGAFLTAIATVVGALAVIFSVDYMHAAKQLGRYYALVLFFIGSMAGLALTTSLLFLFLFWEITALCSYALISFYNDDPRAVAGGVKALIITSIGGVGLFAGALAIRAQTGTYDITAFIAGAQDFPPALLGWLAFGFLAAAAAKSAQFPFQTWLPDAMEAPSPVSALIHAATMVNAGVYLLARFYPAFAPVPGWTFAVSLTGVITALLAGLMALTANDLKRALAYSTVSQLGYMVYAVGSGGLFASQFHLFSHAVFKALLFLAAGAVIHTVGTRDMQSMGGLGKKMPFIRNAFLVGALALAGAPIFNGFWSKELVLEAGWKAGPFWMWLAMVIGAGLTGLYTFRMAWMVFFAPEAGRGQHPIHDAAPAMRISLGVLTLGTATSWLAGGRLGHLLHGMLIHPGEHAPTLGEIVSEVIFAPQTYFTLAVIALGVALFWVNVFFPRVRFSWLKQVSVNSFGFEWVNRLVVRLTQAGAAQLSRSQTGKLNWNVFGILLALAVVLGVMLWK
jgi:NADH-quinone oxidoreductase subunit L